MPGGSLHPLKINTFLSRRTQCVSFYVVMYGFMYLFIDSGVKERWVFFTAPVALRLHLKKPTPTGFFTPAASRWTLIIGNARVSTTEQNLGLQHDDLKPARDAWVDRT